MRKYRFGVRMDRKIRKIQKPAFSGVPGINKNYQITQDSTPLDIIEIFFSTDLFFYKKVLAQNLKYKARPAAQQADS
jgi:hypothetical protein